MTDEWKQPILGIMTYKSGTNREHSYGVLFDGATGVDLAHVRMINYAGLPKPPCAAPTDQGMPADSGIFMAVTPYAADHLVNQIENLKAELSATPPIKRYFYTPHVTPDASRPGQTGDRNRFTHSLPTNCAHFLMQAAQHAGIDVASINRAWPHADCVEQLSQPVEKAMAAAGADSFRSGLASNGQPLLYFQSPQECALMPLLRKIPAEALAALHKAPPLTEVYKDGIQSHQQTPDISR